jgi:DNA invertase Pin-like site-specific DNA recombinase
MHSVKQNYNYLGVGMSERYICYYRVSTIRQGQSGLGLDDQRAKVAGFLNGVEPIASFTEIESGKGADALERRPKLKEALNACRKHKATLLIAKLDRLARNVHFVTGLMQQGVDFRAADMPQADKVMIQMYSVMAEWERDQISARTKAALAQAKLRGVILGRAGPANLRPNNDALVKEANDRAEKLRHLIGNMVSRKLTEAEMASELNGLKMKTVRGAMYTVNTVRRIRARLAMMPALAKAA